MGKGPKLGNPFVPNSFSVNVAAFCLQKEMLQNVWKNSQTCVFFKYGWYQLCQMQQNLLQLASPVLSAIMYAIMI
jgi:hypothetical protein